MSTRGTYTIRSKQYDAIRTDHFYIHHDNYLEGGAEYFKLFIENRTRRGGNACRFIRAVENAEFTDHPDNHGDTEYHYELAEDLYITAHKIERDYEKGTKAKRCVFAGYLEEFVNEYLEKVEGQWGTPVKLNYLYYNGDIYEEGELLKLYNNSIERNLRTLALGHVGNACFAEAYVMHKVLHPINREIPKEIVFASKLLCKAYNWEDEDEYLEKIIMNGAVTKGLKERSRRANRESMHTL